MNRFWKSFWECECGSECVVITYDNGEDEIPNVYLSIFSHGIRHRNGMDFKEKLRYIWQVLWHSKPFEDCIMLSQSNAKELGEALIEFSEKSYKFGDKK